MCGTAAPRTGLACPGRAGGGAVGACAPGTGLTCPAQWGPTGTCSRLQRGQGPTSLGEAGDPEPYALNKPKKNIKSSPQVSSFYAVGMIWLLARPVLARCKAPASKIRTRDAHPKSLVLNPEHNIPNLEPPTMSPNFLNLIKNCLWMSSSSVYNGCCCKQR